VSKVSAESVAIDLVLQGLAAVGAVALPVSGGSMMPTLRPGERVVLRPFDPATIAAQDVVAFRTPDDVLVLHRVHIVAADHLVTAGDAKQLFDPPVPMSDVIGVVPGLPPRPAPRRWPATPVASQEPGTAPSVDIWLIGDDATSVDGLALPSGWRLHHRPTAPGGTPPAVLAELCAATAGKPFIGISPLAVHDASEVLRGELPEATQIVIGVAFGRWDRPQPGVLLPGTSADTQVRIGPPTVSIGHAEVLRHLLALTSPGGRS
jgi:hypothetical protein